uniref:Uncharacterized protein n=1 Tax=Ascaris lumbricoides TaxID=6252 RepID=A0A0M3HN40_ASCLU
MGNSFFLHIQLFTSESPFFQCDKSISSKQSYELVATVRFYSAISCHGTAFSAHCIYSSGRRVYHMLARYRYGAKGYHQKLENSLTEAYEIMLNLNLYTILILFPVIQLLTILLYASFVNTDLWRQQNFQTM